MQTVLISTYDLGRQPFGLASAAAWLRAAGHTVVCADLSVGTLPPGAVECAGLVGFYLPMHTATRLAIPVIRRVRRLNPDARLCAFGLYAPLNQQLLREAGVETLIGGEFEAALVELASGGQGPDLLIPVERLRFQTPDRTGLPELRNYAALESARGRRVAGSTEASRGCKHMCRHCPVVPVYNGTFRIVQADVVMEDIRRQVAAGAGHITFGDPDFFNGPGHTMRIVEALHREFPDLSYDVTIKVEHLKKQRSLLPGLKETGCAFVTSAVESLDDRILALLEKGHTRADFCEVAALFRNIGLNLSPTFIAFTPWTTLESWRDLLGAIRDLDLIDQTSPIQLALRLLVTARSRLLELEDIEQVRGDFDPESLTYPWKHSDPRVDELAREAFTLVSKGQTSGWSRRRTFAELWGLAGLDPLPENFDLLPRAAVPYLNEPWYC